MVILLEMWTSESQSEAVRMELWQCTGYHTVVVYIPRYSCLTTVPANQTVRFLFCRYINNCSERVTHVGSKADSVLHLPSGGLRTFWAQGAVLSVRDTCVQVKSDLQVLWYMDVPWNEAEAQHAIQTRTSWGAADGLPGAQIGLEWSFFFFKEY